MCIDLFWGESEFCLTLARRVQLCMAPLDTAGWAHNGSGEIVNGQMRSPEGDDALFKHPQELQGGDVWRMRVSSGGDPAWASDCPKNPGCCLGLT